jgi:hypothetical protein
MKYYEDAAAGHHNSGHYPRLLQSSKKERNPDVILSRLSKHRPADFAYWKRAASKRPGSWRCVTVTTG